MMGAQRKQIIETFGFIAGKYIVIYRHRLMNGSLHLRLYHKISNICKIMFDILGLLPKKKTEFMNTFIEYVVVKMPTIWKMRRKEMLWNIKRPDPIRLKRNKDRLHNLLCSAGGFGKLPYFSSQIKIASSQIMIEENDKYFFWSCDSLLCLI